MWTFLLLLSLGTIPKAGPGLWPFVLLFWGLVYCWLHFWKGWV